METITEDQFFEEFEPVTNMFESDTAFEGCLFETYGEEKEFINKMPVDQVWTVTEEDGIVTIMSGLRLVNKLGYIVTEKKYTEETIVTLD